MNAPLKIALVFPGQGAQYPGMGREFFENYATVRETFQESDELLRRNLSSIILNGPQDLLTQTRNSQTAIFIMSVALLRVLKEEFPALTPAFCAGLSLGEYTALHASGRISYSDCLPLVQHRGEFMNEACEATNGTMAVIMGLASHEVEQLVGDLNLPHDLWVANFNCPGQVVISGTRKGIEAGAASAKERGAKRILPLQVHGAFHSGLMRQAEHKLQPYIDAVSLKAGASSLVMNVTGTTVQNIDTVKANLVKQVTHPVRWEQSVRHMVDAGATLFIEVGCGKTLSGFNKRIGVPVPTINVETPADLEAVAQYF